MMQITDHLDNNWVLYQLDNLMYNLACFTTNAFKIHKSSACVEDIPITISRNVTAFLTKISLTRLKFRSETLQHLQASKFCKRSVYYYTNKQLHNGKYSGRHRVSSKPVKNSINGPKLFTRRKTHRTNSREHNKSGYYQWYFFYFKLNFSNV
jgi:hypothetical protein